jgi:hypothetical protein
VWNGRPWLRYLLSIVVILNFGVGLVLFIAFVKIHGLAVVGLAVAIWGSLIDAFTSETENKIAGLYQAWAWTAFVLNSAMSTSILLRIGYI